MEVKSIKIDLNVRPSANLCRKLMLSLFEHLLYSRSQIPFSFGLFKNFIELKAKNKDETKQGVNWKIQKQLKLASETYEKICIVKDILETSIASEILIIFGSTIYTPKESYHILFPTVNELMLPTFINETNFLKRILLTIIENDELKTNNDQQLSTTNIFVLLKLQKPCEDHSDLVELRKFKLAKSCRKFSIQFKTDFNIFEDFQEMSLSENTLPTTDDEDDVWHQSKTFVKGFKDILVNDQSIWN